ncbi:four helix bundle protein [Orbaceae bacterium ac157xtp]
MNEFSTTAFKHPKIYADLSALYMSYWQQHQRLPKPFRFTTGERILTQLDDCMHIIIEANLVNKNCPQECKNAAEMLRKVRTTLIVIRGFLHNAWRLKFISHKCMAQFQIQLDEIEKQVTKWQQWYILKSS